MSKYSLLQRSGKFFKTEKGKDREGTLFSCSVPHQGLTNCPLLTLFSSILSLFSINCKYSQYVYIIYVHVNMCASCMCTCVYADVNRTPSFCGQNGYHFPEGPSPCSTLLQKILKMLIIVIYQYKKKQTVSQNLQLISIMICLSYRT